MIELIEKVAPFIVSIGLTGWVYQTLNSVIKSLREEVTQLTNDISSLKRELATEREEKNKWYRKYQKLLNIFKKSGGCQKNCPVAKELDKHLAEEGETL